MTFTKSDDTLREMRCTLKEDAIEQTEKKTERVRKENNDILSVWDLDKNAWRSFRLDSVKEFNFNIA